MSTLTVAVDGFSSTGKSTLAKQLANELGLTYVDSGAMYRAVALHALRKGYINDMQIDRNAILEELSNIQLHFVKQEGGVQARIHLNGEDVEDEIRSMEVNRVVSQVSSISAVRKKLVELQKQMGRDGGVVMDGRDIGTVVFPNADLKVYMTADADVRAQRRFDELLKKGRNVSLEEVKANLLMRDKQDQERLDSPLLKAEDAVELDNSFLSAEEQLQRVLRMVGALNRE